MTEGALTQVVTATGTLNPVINVTVGSQISGYIQELHADFNSSVKAGQIIAKLDPATFLATVHQAEGDLAQAQAALELARLTAKRKKELVAQNAAPQADLDAALATLEPGAGHRADQGGQFGKGAGRSRPLHHPLADRWHGHFAQRGCGSDGGREPECARSFS